MGVVVRKHIDFLRLLIPTYFVSALLCKSIHNFVHFYMLFVLVYNINKLLTHFSDL